jgi:hypothetical protein
MSTNRAELLLEVLRQQENEIAPHRRNSGIFSSGEVLRQNVAELSQLVKETNIGEDEFFVNRFARAAVLMAFGLDHEKLHFAKYKFYERIYSFCRQGVKVAIIVRRHEV